MATLNTTVKVTEGNFTRFNNILSTVTTGDNFDFRQVTADAAITDNAAGAAVTIETDIATPRLCVVESQSATKTAYMKFGAANVTDWGAETVYNSLIPPSSAILLYLPSGTTNLNFASEDANNIDLKVYVHED